MPRLDSDSRAKQQHDCGLTGVLDDERFTAVALESVGVLVTSTHARIVTWSAGTSISPQPGHETLTIPDITA